MKNSNLVHVVYPFNPTQCHRLYRLVGGVNKLASSRHPILQKTLRSFDSCGKFVNPFISGRPRASCFQRARNKNLIKNFLTKCSPSYTFAISSRPDISELKTCPGALIWVIYSRFVSPSECACGFVLTLRAGPFYIPGPVLRLFPKLRII